MIRLQPQQINGHTGYPFHARDDKGTKQTYYCNHNICPMWDHCVVRLTDRLQDIHPNCPFKQPGK